MAKQKIFFRATEKDAVDFYIAKFSKELGKVEGKPAAYVEKAQTQLQELQIDSLTEAEQNFKRTLILDSNNAPAMAGLAEVYSELGAYREDDDLFTVAYDFAFKSMKIAAQNSLAPRSMARLILRINTVRPSEKLDEVGGLLDAVLQLDPHDLLALTLKGEWYLATAQRNK